MVKYVDEAGAVVKILAKNGDDVIEVGQVAARNADELGAVASVNAKTPDFIVTPRGEAIAVPVGSSGPVDVINPSGSRAGSAYVGGHGGLNGQVSSVRIMDPTPARGRPPGYPGGYVKYENALGQGVDYITGRTLSNAKSHIPLTFEFE